MSERMEAVVAPPTQLTDEFGSIRVERDPASGKTQYFGLKEIPISEIDYLHAYGISEKDLNARALDAKKAKETPKNTDVPFARSSKSKAGKAKEKITDTVTAAAETVKDMLSPEVSQLEPELTVEMKQLVELLVNEKMALILEQVEQLEQSEAALKEENNRLNTEIAELRGRLPGSAENIVTPETETSLSGSDTPYGTTWEQYNAQKPGSFWDRFRAGFYGAHSRLATARHNKNYTYDDNGRLVKVEEERKGGLGRGILIGALGGLVVGYILWKNANNGIVIEGNGLDDSVRDDAKEWFGDRHDELESFFDADLDDDGDIAGVNISPDENNAPGAAVEGEHDGGRFQLAPDPGQHREYYDGGIDPLTVAGDASPVAVDLPPEIDMSKNSSGKYDLVGPGFEIRSIEWDHQGNLADWVQDDLRKRGYDLHQHGLRYFDDTYPGKRGWVTHYVTAVSR